MFDQQPNPQPTAPAPANIPTANRPGVDDMFAQTDPTAGQPTAYVPQTQTSYQPSQMMSSLPPNHEMFGGRSFPVRTAIVVVVALMLLGGVGFGAWWVITDQMASEPAIDRNIDVPPTPAPTPTATVPATTPTPTSSTTTTPPVPVFVDTDSDGLSDDQERQLGTNPERVDTDVDGLIDRAEIQVYKTDPLKIDTDGDGYADGAEVFNGYDPLIGGGAKLNQAILPVGNQ